MATHLADASADYEPLPKERILQVGFQMRQSQPLPPSGRFDRTGRDWRCDLVLLLPFFVRLESKGWQYPDPETGKRKNWVS